MGFGYLLIGYILAFAFSLSNVYFFADIIGALVMLIGLMRLAQHGTNFLRAAWADMAYLLICLVRAVLMMLRLLPTDGAGAAVFAVLIAVSALVLHFFLLAAIYYISEQLALEKESRRAKRNLALIFAYYFLYLIAFLLTPLLGTAGNILALCVTVFGLAVIVSNILLLHSCYCRICLKGQEKGERVKSRYEWLNRFREKTDAMFDGAFLRKPKQKTGGAEPTAEPGYLRVKRKKNQKHK